MEELKKRKSLIFTLVELLIVIGIIAIMAALLLPALNTARAAAHKINCAGNQKTIGTALQFYSNDFKDWMVPLSLIAGQAGYDSVNGWWWTFILEGAYIVRWPNLIPGYPSIIRSPGYIPKGASKVFLHPPENHSLDYVGLGIGMNMYCGRISDGSNINLKSIKSPSTKILLTDSKTQGDPGYTGNSLGSESSQNTFRYFPKHSNYQRANVLFVDGHVKDFGSELLNNSYLAYWTLP